MLVVGACIGGCGDDGPEPTAQRGGGPAPAPATSKTPESGGEAPAGKAEATPAAAPVPGQPGAAPEGEAAAEEKPSPAARVPTASELLGLGRRSGSGGEGLPGFISERMADQDPNAASPLFTGNAAAPSGRYSKLRVSPLGVSPLERHWGSKEDLYGKTAARKKPKAPVVAATAPNVRPGGKIFDGKAVEPSAEAVARTGPDGQEGKDETARFRLVLYKLDPKTGSVETFDRSYASEEARNAAESYALRRGFAKKKPTDKEIEDIKSQLQAAKAEKGEPKRDECRFRAYWTEKGTRQSRCFESQAALDAFTARRRARSSQNKEKKPTTAPRGGGGDSLAPVKLPK